MTARELASDDSEFDRVEEESADDESEHGSGTAKPLEPDEGNRRQRSQSAKISPAQKKQGMQNRRSIKSCRPLKKSQPPAKNLLGKPPLKKLPPKNTSLSQKNNLQKSASKKVGLLSKTISARRAAQKTVPKSSTSGNSAVHSEWMIFDIGVQNCKALKKSGFLPGTMSSKNATPQQKKSSQIAASVHMSKEEYSIIKSQISQSQKLAEAKVFETSPVEKPSSARSAQRENISAQFDLSDTKVNLEQQATSPVVSKLRDQSPNNPQHADTGKTSIPMATTMGTFLPPTQEMNLDNTVTYLATTGQSPTIMDQDNTATLLTTTNMNHLCYQAVTPAAPEGTASKVAR